MNLVRQFLMTDDAATAVEYAVMLALIIGLMITTLRAFGSASGGMWANNVTELQNHGF
jgi:pilus assembly protein Flp/PilA